jgi:hypothetical protein
MLLEQQVEVLKRIEQVATLAGVKGDIDDQRAAFRIGFQLDAGRHQAVYVRFSGKTVAGQIVVTFFSPCLIVKKGFLAGLSKAQALDLLRRNEGMLIARYGIWEAPSESMIVASVDHFLESLDPHEFEASAVCVAMAADQYEREHHQDEF